MKKLLGGFATIAIAAGIIIGGTGAFFGDTETSSGNVFAAGAFDLLIDNESYYNGNKCENVSDNPEVEDWEWVGEADYPVPGTPCTTSFELSNLDDGRLFFDFDDVKPDDEGEDTISIHVQNDSWACMDMSLTSNDDTSSTEPELGDGDVEEDENDTWDGELAQNIQMVWWADDGDNVLEEGENLLSDGVQTLYNLAYANGSWSLPLADSQTNVWGDASGTPLPGGETVYIAKAWCLGTLSEDREEQDRLGNTGDNGPMDRGTGILCDGEELGNETQTDSATLDIAFRAVQARHNPDYVCEDEQPRVATLTVNKVVVNNNGGNNVVADFQLFVDNGVVNQPVTSGIATEFSAGDYTVNESGISGYQASFSGDCNGVGQITLEPGDDKLCTITNTELPANLTLFKEVIGGDAQPTVFGLRVAGNLVQHNQSVPVMSNTPYSINEDGRAGYIFTSITGHPKCPANLGETVTLDEGESITCIITNTFSPVASQIFFSESFGTGATDTTLNESTAPPHPQNVWVEGGAGAEKRNAAGGGDNSLSDGDGGRFAALFSTDGTICRMIDASAHESLELAYQWRGDTQAVLGDEGVVEFFTTGSCAAPGALTTLAMHDLRTTAWTSNGIVLPGSLDGTSFFLRFRNDAATADVDFRLDAIEISGTLL